MRACLYYVMKMLKYLSVFEFTKGTRTFIFSIFLIIMYCENELGTCNIDKLPSIILNYSIRSEKQLIFQDFVSYWRAVLHDHCVYLQSILTFSIFKYFQDIRWGVWRNWWIENDNVKKSLWQFQKKKCKKTLASFPDSYQNSKMSNKFS